MWGTLSSWPTGQWALSGWVYGVWGESTCGSLGSECVSEISSISEAPELDVRWHNLAALS
uniref:DUF3778 domain-containing protein n=1 Tax=Oryza rufipogon TaxID=4529 RepID=A0A0E0MQR3_ORYRU